MSIPAIVSAGGPGYDWNVEKGCLIGIFLSCFCGAVYTFCLGKWVLKQSQGTPEMQKVSDAIREGANAFVRVQYTTMAKISLIVGVLLFVVYAWLRDETTIPKSKYLVAFWVMFIFFAGALFSALTGILGMWISVQTNVRAAAAADISTDMCLRVCFRGGAFSGMLILTLSIFGVIGAYSIARAGFDIPSEQVPYLIVGLSFGASFIALFAQLGGGIYTKAADVGADLVGKVENDIPEDDPRNPAVVADLVGDNVGDCAGRGADLYESMTAENIGAMILGATVAKTSGHEIQSKTGFILFPLVVHCAGMFSSMIAILTVRLITHKKKRGRGPTETRSLVDSAAVNQTAPSSADFEGRHEPTPSRHSQTPVGTPSRPEPIGLEDGKQVVVEHKAAEKPDEDEGEENGMTSLIRGYIICLTIASVLLVILCRLLLYSEQHPRAWLHFFGAGIIGILLSWAFVYITDYYTSTEYFPVKKIATAGNQGHGPVVIHGLAVGMESTGLPVVCIGVALLSSYWLGASSGLGDWPSCGIYGTACATMGMLITCGYILAMDTFGPISDNAGGVAEMSGSPEHIRRRTDKLDCVGNTTKALTKGYAVGTAGLATFLLFRAFLDEVADYTGDNIVKDVNLAIPEVFVSGLYGVMIVIFFASLAMTAVGSAAQVVITEVRRQFQERPGILQHTDKPDYDACVAIVTKSALKEMVLPGILVVLSPIVLGLIMRGLGEAQGFKNLAIPCLAAYLMTVTMGGVNFGLFLNNAGGAWDNAKKLVATGKGWGGKHSEAHKSCVTGDTVGDPCKDTAGPSLHVLVKLISTITLVWYPLFVNGTKTP